MKNQQVRDMTTGSPMKLIIQFVIPIVLGTVFQQIYNVVDTIVVGKFLGVSAMAGVGSVGPLHFMLVGFTGGLCSGFTITIAQKFGQKDYEEMRQFWGNVIVLGGIFSVTFAIFTTAITRPMLILMKNPPETFDYAYRYCVCLFAGIPATMLYNLLTGVFRALGNSRTPVLFLIISSIINVILDVTFVVVFHMNVMGVSVATVISQLISGILCMIYLIRNFPILKLSRQNLKLRRHCVTRLLAMGLPMGLHNSLNAVGTIILQTAVNGLGAEVMAAITAGSKLTGIFQSFMASVGAAHSNFTAQNAGAGKLDRIGKSFRSGEIIGGIYYIVLMSAVLIFGEQMCMIFVKAEEVQVITLCRQYVICNAAAIFMVLNLLLLRTTLQGLGYSKLMIMDGSCEMIGRILVAVFLIPRLGFAGACFANLIAWSMGILILIPINLSCMHKEKVKAAASQQSISSF